MSNKSQQTVETTTQSRVRIPWGRDVETRFKVNRVPVGATPVPRYETWDEHRAEIRRVASPQRR